ncbi:protein matrimony-like [Rhagoletis pomonella]|uniref:protein matrimony-like n=1 Tax=Rhagoletis pomonella TaxID=28610 RepID=UPI001785769C|nr:protein matrimony-like [Rhagoletis pomonella]
MMEDCQTPTLAEVMEFKYEVTPTMVFDSSCLQEAHNLIVNRISVRCFTPTIQNFQSPGLSPITECTQTLVGGVAVEGTPISMPMMSNANNEIFKAPKNPKGTHQKSALPLQQQQQQQQQQQPCQKNFSSSHFVSDSPPIFTLNSTTISDTDFSTEIASPDSAAILGSYGNNNNNNNSGSNSNNSSSDSDKLNSSNNATFTNNNNNGTNASKNLSNTNLLDRTMNVSTLLRSVGLEQYVEAFEEQNLDLEQFLNIRTEDFQRLGVTKAKHQQKLLDLLSELNGAEI